MSFVWFSVLIGYARVSTDEQRIDLQVDALRTVGCEQIFEDRASGGKVDRPGLRDALAYLRDRADDTLVIWRLDRLGRSLPHLIETVGQLDRRGIGLRSLQENLDTNSPSGRLIFHIMGALAEFERSLIKERTNAGLAAARARGRKGGRPRILDEKQIKMARHLLQDPSTRTDDVCTTLGVSRATLYRALGARTNPLAA